VNVVWRGTIEYGQALDEQRAYRERVIAREAPEALWLLEHPPVITLGRRAGEVELDRDTIRAAGFAVHETERGGLATCHEPGQLVGYVFFDASRLGVRRTVETLEDGLLAWCAGRGLGAGRRDGYPGIWVGHEKICALGLHVRLGVTMHGFALNLVNDLRGFGLITPCGITDGGVTTVGRLIGEQGLAPAMVWEEVGSCVVAAFSEASAGGRAGAPDGAAKIDAEGVDAPVRSKYMGGAEGT